MKIVVIYAQGAPGGVNRKLHLDFFEKMKDLCSEYYSFLVNRGDLQVKTSDDIERINDEYKPDVAILYQGRLGRNRVHNGHFSKFKCLKVMIEVDYHDAEARELNSYYGKDFYRKNDIDLIVQRGSYIADPKIGIPSVWLPFSADENVFFPGKENRINKVGIGATITESYPNRRRIVEKLKEKDLLVDCGRRCKDESGRFYPDFLRSIDVGLNATEKDVVTPFGKLFEYAASGVAILSPVFYRLEQLFGKDSVFEYKEDGSDVVRKARDILNDHDRRREIADKTYKNYINNHTDKIRINEMYDILKDMLEGRDPRRKWGI